MKCLSLLQPWATLVSIGAKKIETRSWNTHYRGPLAIAVSKKLPPDAEYFCYGERFFDALVDGFCQPNNIVPSKMVERLPLGSILCVCDLVDVVRITADNAPPEPERSFGHYTPGRYAWHLASVRALPEPIPVTGKRGLWVPDAPILEQLERFYKGAG